MFIVGISFTALQTVRDVKSNVLCTKMSQVLYLSCRERQEQIMDLLQVQVRYEQEEHEGTGQDDKCKGDSKGNQDDNGQEG